MSIEQALQYTGPHLLSVAFSDPEKNLRSQVLLRAPHIGEHDCEIPISNEDAPIELSCAEFASLRSRNFLVHSGIDSNGTPYWVLFNQRSGAPRKTVSCPDSAPNEDEGKWDGSRKLSLAELNALEV